MKKFRFVDEVLDFAINREIEAQDFYVKLAGFVEKPEMAKVLLDLASEELEHKAKLESVKAGEIGIDEEEVGKFDITDYVKDVEQHPKMSYVDLLVVGMKKEERDTTRPASCLPFYSIIRLAISVGSGR